MSYVTVSILLPAASGVAAWLITNWIGRPIVELETLRRQIREELYFWQHLWMDWLPGKITEVEDAYRRLAARLEAISVVSLKPLQWYVQLRQWDLAKAASNLRGLSNVRGSLRDERTILTHAVETALQLPTTDDSERIRRIEERVFGKVGGTT